MNKEWPMSKPVEHAKRDVHKFGGQIEDYLPIHNWFDQTKAFMPDMRHRAILHNAFGIYLCEQVFGPTIKNSDGNIIATRTIAERHVLQDLKHIPTFHDCFGDMQFKDWMMGYHPGLRKMVLGKLENDRIDLRGDDA
jgi:hypothetical protein